MERLTTHDAGTRAPAGWTLLVDGLQTRVAVPDLTTGLALLGAIGTVVAGPAQRSGCAPDLRLQSTTLDVRLTTPAVHGVTEADLHLATLVTTVVEEAGLVASTTGAGRLELGLDTPAAGALGPFWAAVLGAEHRTGPDVGDEVRDPCDALPTVWFQGSGAAEPRQHWHPDLWVDPAAVPGRIDAALAAGGTLVSDAEAPAFWVLADPEDNRVCLCTWQSRGETS